MILNGRVHTRISFSGLFYHQKPLSSADRGWGGGLYGRARDAYRPLFPISFILLGNISAQPIRFLQHFKSTNQTETTIKINHSLKQEINDSFVDYDRTMFEIFVISTVCEI